MIYKITACALGFLVAALSVPIGMRIAVGSYLYGDILVAPKSQTALVLGASVARGVPSPVLAQRADAAVALYRSGKVSKILVTGDSRIISYDEVTPVRKYLVDVGIPSENIFLDHAGYDTYSSMYRAREVFQAQSLIIVTQDFHLPRALWIARHLGLDASGVISGTSGSFYDYVREIPASMKALLDVFSHRKPLRLGETVSLSGDGELTW